MTDKARELLERAMESLDERFFYILKLKEKIRAYLAAEECPQNAEKATRSEDVVTEATDQEPVAWMEYSPDGKYWFLAYSKNPEVKTKPLFLHPAPRPDFVRLSEEEVTEILTSAYDMYSAICAVENRLVKKNK